MTSLSLITLNVEQLRAVAHAQARPPAAGGGRAWERIAALSVAVVAIALPVLMIFGA